MKITQSKVADLVPYVNNSRNHSDEQVAQIVRSIQEFGWTNHILIDGDKGIIAGHGRLKAAQVLGLSEVPTIELQGLSDEQKKAYIIADNKLALNASWDKDILALEVADLEAAGFDIDILAFDPSELIQRDIDYSVLDEENLDDKLNEMSDGVKKAIQIEFDIDDFTEAQELVKFWRNQGAYVGGLVMDALRKEKDRL